MADFIRIDGHYINLDRVKHISPIYEDGDLSCLQVHFADEEDAAAFGSAHFEIAPEHAEWLADRLTGASDRKGLTAPPPVPHESKPKYPTSTADDSLQTRVRRSDRKP